MVSVSGASGGGVKMEVQEDAVVLVRSGQTMSVCLKSPRLDFGELGWVGGLRPEHIRGDIASGRRVEITYAAQRLGANGVLQVEGFVQWSAKEQVLRKWALCKLKDASEPALLREVMLDDIDATGWDEHAGDPVQSYPAFGRGVFAGVEYPISFTRVEKGRLILSHKPGTKLVPGTWYATRKAVYGLTPPGQEKIGFNRYVALNRPKPKGMHLDYNSWWTSPVPYSEESMMELMHSIRDNLYKPYGVSLDSFCIDLGWSEPESAWEINRKLFPQGFEGIKRGAEEMNSHLGLWISPSAFYSPHAIDIDWMKQRGYEILPVPGSDMRLCCLGGKRYQTLFRERLLEMATRWGVRQFKFDGCYLQCSEADHGHESGEMSSEAIGEGVIAAFDAVHKAAPSTWMETTCFGWNPSPWWLFHVNSVLGTHGDDAPHGRVPCPIGRESYTTARDYFNLQGAVRIRVPIVAQEVLGIVHQTDEPFLNDAVTTVMRGHMFLPIYINPRDMNPGRWKAMAELLTWARANSGIMQQTLPILPSSWQGRATAPFSNDAEMPRETYGYAHGNGKRSLVELRNPWIAEAKHQLTLDESCGLSRGSDGFSVVSLYPELRLYGKDLSFGDQVDIPLAPYETVVLSIAPKQSTRNIPTASTGGVSFTSTRRDVSFSGIQQVAVELEVEVEVSSPRAELLFLVEDKAPVTAPSGKIVIDGVEAVTTSTGTAGAWVASSIPAVEHWMFLRAPLSTGKHTVSIEMSVSGEAPKVSAWVWGTKLPSADSPAYPNALPSPELISVGSACLLQPVAAGEP